jgi:hypothetical protein
VSLDPELFPALNTVIPAGAPMTFPVPMGTSDVMECINEIDSRLIADLVANIRKPEDILSSYGITQEQLAKKLLNPMFVQHFKDTQRLWNSDMNAQQRIRAKAAFILEDTLPQLHKIASGQQTPVNAKLAAIEQLTKISTVAHVPKEASAGGEKHSIVINIGGDKQPIIIAEQK